MGNNMSELKDILYRRGKKEDSLRIAELDYIASDGAIEFLFHDLIPDMSPTQIVTSNLENDAYPHSYKSVIVAEQSRCIIGMALSFPGKYHKITKEMQEFLPENRLNHFRKFFSAPVHDSYFLDAICVDGDYRNNGIGSQLIKLTKTKARDEGYNLLSLIVFKDNTIARNTYRKNGFKAVDTIELKSDRLMPHEGGCLLMQAEI